MAGITYDTLSLTFEVKDRKQVVQRNYVDASMDLLVRRENGIAQGIQCNWSTTDVGEIPFERTCTAVQRGRGLLVNVTFSLGKEDNVSDQRFCCVTWLICFSGCSIETVYDESDFVA